MFWTTFVMVLLVMALFVFAAWASMMDAEGRGGKLVRGFTYLAGGQVGMLALLVFSHWAFAWFGTVVLVYVAYRLIKSMS